MSIDRHWQRLTPLSLALFPLSLLFRAVVAARRFAYRAGWLRSHRVGVPVVIVGNIAAGGTGKTPLVLWLTDLLRRRGWRPGIVSRGYGAPASGARAVAPDACAADVGDEPVLLARRSQCPVWVGTDRVAAARALLAAHPSCNVLVLDDGLQHYALGRDIEIAVVDGARGFGNGLMLPAGPLREPPARLATVDAVVVNGAAERRLPHRAHGMRLEGRGFRNLVDAAQEVGPEYFRGRRVHAIAGIGNPQRFFAHLEALGLSFEAQPFPDHHAYTPREIEFPAADAVVMTEKDAVKCAPFASRKHWVLPVDAAPDSELGELVLRKLRP